MLEIEEVREHRSRGGSERVLPARVVSSSDSVHERVRVEAAFNGQRDLAEAVQIRQGGTPAHTEFTDVPNCYVVSQASAARLVGEHCRVGTAMRGQVADALLDESREDTVVEGLALFGPGVARRLGLGTDGAHGSSLMVQTSDARDRHCSGAVVALSWTPRAGSSSARERKGSPRTAHPRAACSCSADNRRSPTLLTGVERRTAGRAPRRQHPGHCQQVDLGRRSPSRRIVEEGFAPSASPVPRRHIRLWRATAAR